MVARTKPSKAKANVTNNRASALSLVVVGAVWVALLWGSADATDRGLGLRVRDFEQYLPEEWGEVRALKSSKKEKSYDDDSDDYYSSKGSKGSYYGSKGSYYGSKSSKKSKSCKSCIDIDSSSDDSNSTSYSDSKSYKSKGSKGSKSISEKGSKGSKGSKSSKKSSGSGSGSDPGHPPDVGFPPEVVWNVTFPDAVATGTLLYDDDTGYALYAYTAKVSEDAFIGKVCPIYVSEGKAIDMCIEIEAPEEWEAVTSTELIVAEPCSGPVDGSIVKLAVIVEDTSEDGLVGSRMLVYDSVVGSKDKKSDPKIIEVGYEGWKSLYSEPGINGKPAFSPDCKKVYASWLTPLGVDLDGEDVIDLVSSITIATNVEEVTEESAEMWRLGTSGRLVGLTPTKDGKTLISATNVPEEDTVNTGGVVALDAETGKIMQSYPFPADAESEEPHNAFTNPVMDDSGNSYHIDSLLGLVKFDTDDLNDGPVWTAVGGPIEVVEPVEVEVADIKKAAVDPDEKNVDEEVSKRNLEPERPRNKKGWTVMEDLSFTAFQPALESDFATIYACGSNALGDDVNGVTAMATKNGGYVWRKEFTDHHLVNVGSCSGITADIVVDDSSVSSTGDAVYVARDKVVQALDTHDGKTLWTYRLGGHDVTTFVVVDENLVVAANMGRVVGLSTIKPLPPSATPAPTTKKPSSSTGRPSRSPIRAPTVVTPDPMPSSASTTGLSYVVAVLSALPLLLAVLR